MLGGNMSYRTFMEPYGTTAFDSEAANYYADMLQETVKGQVFNTPPPSVPQADRPPTRLARNATTPISLGDSALPSQAKRSQA